MLKGEPSKLYSSGGERYVELCFEENGVEISRYNISFKQLRKLNFNRTPEKTVKLIKQEFLFFIIIHPFCINAIFYNLLFVFI